MFVLRALAAFLWFLTGWATYDAFNGVPNANWAAPVIGLSAFIASVLAHYTKDE